MSERQTDDQQREHSEHVETSVTSTDGGTDEHTRVERDGETVVDDSRHEDAGPE